MDQLRTQFLDYQAIPPPVEYKQMLEFIIDNPFGSPAKSREWARKELVRIQPDEVLVTEWSRETKGVTTQEWTERLRMRLRQRP